MTDNEIIGNLKSQTKQDLQDTLEIWKKPWFNNPHKRQIIRCLKKAIESKEEKQNERNINR